MKSLGLGRCALTIGAAAALLAGCGGSQTGGPVPMDLIHFQTQVPNPQTSSGDLVYATGACGGVCVFSYPSGKLKHKISLTYPVAGVCSDSNGNVFVTNYEQPQVLEYAHGGTTPIGTLTVPGSGTAACGVNLKTSDLAVVFGGDGYDNIAMFKNETGTPTIYSTGYGAAFCGYDNNGNLFVSGRDNGLSILSELPYGSSTFMQISFYAKGGGGPNQVQWDGHYMTWETFGRKDTSILRFTLSGSVATVTGKTHLRGPQWITQSWIAGDRVIVPYASQGGATNKIGVWRYPKGGRILAKFGNFGQNANTRVLGVALSVAPSHK
jgi:hypothetical protein